jgi:hypothetical protein
MAWGLINATARNAASVNTSRLFAIIWLFVAGFFAWFLLLNAHHLLLMLARLV